MKLSSLEKKPNDKRLPYNNKKHQRKKPGNNVPLQTGRKEDLAAQPPNLSLEEDFPPLGSTLLPLEF
jgi:hypothetical protein